MLIDSKVRVICRRVFKDASVQIIRGIVVEETDIYLKIKENSISRPLVRIPEGRLKNLLTRRIKPFLFLSIP